MKAFAYHVATNAEQATKLLGDKTLALAGGTSLLNLMKNRVVEPEAVVNISRLADSSKIQAEKGGLRLGANVRLADLAESAELQKSYPALAQAAANVASPQIRHMGTLGGNLCQRPYCWYFTQNGFDCLKHGGSGCAAKEGDNEFHAIFGTEAACVAVNPSSLAPALVALDARVQIVGPGGAAKEVAAEDFFVAPKTNPLRETILAPNELVVSVFLPPPATPPGSATYEVRGREANDWPVSIASVALRLEGGVCTDARICLGAVAGVPHRARAAENALKGKPVTAASAAAAAEAAVEGASPLAHNAYKVQTARVCVQRAVLAAATSK